MPKIFGYEDVLIEKRTDTLDWMIKSPEGKNLCLVKFLWIFEPPDNFHHHKYTDLVQATMAAVALLPITPEEKERLFKAYPIISKKQHSMWKYADSAWGSESTSKDLENTVNISKDDKKLLDEIKKIKKQKKFESKTEIEEEHSYKRKIH